MYSILKCLFENKSLQVKLFFQNFQEFLAKIWDLAKLSKFDQLINFGLIDRPKDDKGLIDQVLQRSIPHEIIEIRIKDKEDFIISK